MRHEGEKVVPQGRRGYYLILRPRSPDAMLEGQTFRPMDGKAFSKHREVTLDLGNSRPLDFTKNPKGSGRSIGWGIMNTLLRPRCGRWTFVLG